MNEGTSKRSGRKTFFLGVPTISMTSFSLVTFLLSSSKGLVALPGAIDRYIDRYETVVIDEEEENISQKMHRWRVWRVGGHLPVLASPLETWVVDGEDMSTFLACLPGPPGWSS